MTTNTDVTVIKEPPKDQELKVVCENLEFPDNNLNLHNIRKRCGTSSIIISPSPKKKKKDGFNITSKQFLLGGTLSDPLNLNSLQDEDINKAMNTTPKSSPLHANIINIKKDQVNVIIPKNLADPLELSTCADAKDISDLNLHSLKQKAPQKHDKLLLFQSGLPIENTPENINISENNVLPVDTCTNKKIATAPVENYIYESENNVPYVVQIIEEIKDIIEIELSVQPKDTHNIPVSETNVEKVIKPSPSSEKCKTEIQQNCKISVVCPVGHESIVEKHCKSSAIKSTIPKQKYNKNEPKFKAKNALFKYGNYNRYYGYRNPENEDNRLKVLSERIDLFYGKDILDIGCNIGHITFSVARDFGAKSVVGLDIDRKLINIARKNIQYYINDTTQSSLNLESNYQLNNYESNTAVSSDCNTTQSFPRSLSILYGPMNLPCIANSGRFPQNISFIQGNYVLESDSMLSMETSKFDAILCLSITKWLHLNWGDAGLKRAFKRMYQQLMPGGVLILEAQPWKSYGRRKSLTETIWKNYNSIQLKPPMFTEYLLKEVGFSNYETLILPHNPSKGFQRPLKLYFKSNTLVN